MTQRFAAKSGTVLPEPETGNGRSLRNAVTAYLLDIKARKKSKTHSAYATALKYFLESCSKQTLEQITRADLLAYQIYLREKGQSDRSVANKFENVCSFLKQQKIIVSGPNGLISKNDWPVYTEEEVSVYTDEELKKFFETCNETEKLWFKFFYVTAMREQEVMYVSWSDIDFEQKSITVRENKRFGFRPKVYKGRSIRISADLLDLLKTWKKKSDQTCGLVFPTAGCLPKFDFLDCCKAIAKRAGLNQSDFYLHKFRATGRHDCCRVGWTSRRSRKFWGILTWSLRCATWAHRGMMSFRRRSSRSIRRFSFGGLKLGCATA